MSNSDNSGCLGIVMIVIYVAAWIGTGTLAWYWVEPDSFWGAIKFLIVWGILGYIAQIVGGLIIAGIASMME
jgi:ABC-type sugar transport system permease subunit